MASHSDKITLTAKLPDKSLELSGELKKRGLDIAKEIPEMWKTLETDTTEETKFRASWLLDVAKLALQSQRNVASSAPKIRGNQVAIILQDPTK
jgi:hypothetical protein